MRERLYAVVAKYAIISIALLGLLRATLGLAMSETGAATGKPAAWSGTAYPIRRHIYFTYTVKNTTDRLLPKAEFWVYAPVQQTSLQRTESLEASYPFEMLTDAPGNQILRFTWHNMPPHTTKIVSIRGIVAWAHAPHPLPVPHREAFLRAEKYVESDYPHVVHMARQLAESNDYLTAANIFQWIVQHIHPAGYTRDDRGALEALSKRQGDCTELMYVFVALCRASGIPARGVGGYVVRENTVLKPGDYHNWAEVYLDGAWRVVDPQRRVFIEQQSDYLAMRIISGVIQNPLGNAHRFVAVGEGLHVIMQ